jgi:hypothetical protein
LSELIKELTSLIDPETRKGLLFLTGTSILALTALFFTGFVGTVPGAHDVLKQFSLPDWAYGLMFLLLVYVLFVVIASDDTLYYGNPKHNRFARAFQRNLPSKHLSVALGTDNETATYLWFNEFNKWGDPKNERHEDWKRTFQRGYSCRLIYYLWVFGRNLLCLCGAWLAVEAFLFFYYGRPVANIEAKITVVLVIVLLILSLGICNRTKAGSATGVWRRFDEINERHCSWIDRNLALFKAALPETKSHA